MSFRVYPVTKTEIEHNGYEIKINGQPVQANTARVSAMPFNRRWPGHQRSTDQTELVNFLSLETDEPVVFEITPKEPFEKVEIRPINSNIKPEITNDGKIIFTLEKPAYFTVEPYGRRNALHIFADPISVYDSIKNDENTLYFGKGEHDIGTIELKSNQTLFLDEGAVVYACIHAIDAENIKIIGRGILDNSRNKETILFEANEENNDSAVNNEIRLHTIQLEYCKNIEIEGITIRDSLVYNIRPIGCENLNIRNVKIIGCWRYNSDGINMHNCLNANIDNCFLRTFDDCICVKGFASYVGYYDGDIEKAVHEAMYRNGKSYDVSKNLRVKNCVLWNDWDKCLEIGANTRAEDISDIVFEDCNIIHVTGPALDCMNVHYADIHDVTYRNITVEYDEIIPEGQIQKNDKHKYEFRNPDYSPNLICVEVLYHHEYSAKVTRRGKIRDMHFENISLYGRQKPKIHFGGYSAEAKVSDITVKNLTVNGKTVDKDEIEIHTNEFCENIKIY